MKIKGTHDACGRDFLVQQVLDSQGHCPWDGEPLNEDYTANLVTALREAEVAGTVLEGALEQIADMGAALTLDADSVLGPLRTSLATLEAKANTKAKERDVVT